MHIFGVAIQIRMTLLHFTNDSTGRSESPGKLVGDLDKRDSPGLRKCSFRSSDGLRSKPIYVLRVISRGISSVEFKSSFFHGSTAFMLDIGVQLNIIKLKCINEHTPFDKNETFQLTGITEDVINNNPIDNKSTHFTNFISIYIVPNAYNTTGYILGHFLHRAQCINYADNSSTWRNYVFPFKSQEIMIIPPRCNSGFVIYVFNPEIKTSYLPLFLRRGIRWRYFRYLY